MENNYKYMRDLIITLRGEDSCVWGGGVGVWGTKSMPCKSRSGVTLRLVTHAYTDTHANTKLMYTYTYTYTIIVVP